MLMKNYRFSRGRGLSPLFFDMKKASTRSKKRDKPSVDSAVQEAFELFANNTDELEPSGVRLALSALGIDKTDEQVQALVKKRGIGLADFSLIVAGLAKTRNDASDAWDCLDEDSKGFLTRADLENVANELEEKFSDADFESMLKMAENKDGIVTRESFMAFFVDANL